MPEPMQPELKFIFWRQGKMGKMGCVPSPPEQSLHARPTEARGRPHPQLHSWRSRVVHQNHGKGNFPHLLTAGG